MASDRTSEIGVCQRVRQGVGDGINSSAVDEHHELARISQTEMAKCDDEGDSVVFTSTFPKDKLPKDPTGTWSCETFTVGGVLIRYTPYSFDTFSLKDYRDAGLKVTAQMRRFVSTTHREKWTVKRVGR